MLIADPFLVPITFCVVGGLALVFGPIARAYARRVDRSSSPAVIPGDVAARLERMEQAIESIAIEVERISEGQRFTTRLLSERAADGPRAIPASAERER